MSKLLLRSEAARLVAAPPAWLPPHWLDGLRRELAKPGRISMTRVILYQPEDSGRSTRRKHAALQPQT